MKFLHADEFFGQTVNCELAGMSRGMEQARVSECLEFIRKIHHD